MSTGVMAALIVIGGFLVLMFLRSGKNKKP
jgi:hypothetical protein